MDIEFAYPIYWWAPLGLLAIAAVVLVLRRLERRRRGRLERFIESRLAPRLLVGYDAAVRRPLFWLALIGFVFIVFTIAQPHWGQSWQKVSKQSRDVMVLLDTSESMRADDLRPNRLTRAKFKVDRLMERMPGDRFGVIAFSGGAALQAPPTVDHGYVRAVLDAIDTNTLSREGTDIASALKEAIEVFEEQEASGTLSTRNQRAILLISDGENVEGDVMAAAEEAAEFARIYVMGVGDPRGTEITMPEQLARYRHVDPGERVHLSKLDEDNLIRVATLGDGRYVRSEADDWDVEKLHEFMAEVASRSVSSDVRLRLVNRYQWPLGFAVACFAAEGLWWVIMPWIRRWRVRRAAPAGHEEAGHV